MNNENPFSLIPGNPPSDVGYMSVSFGGPQGANSIHLIYVDLREGALGRFSMMPMSLNASRTGGGRPYAPDLLGELTGNTLATGQCVYAGTGSNRSSLPVVVTVPPIFGDMNISNTTLDGPFYRKVANHSAYLDLLSQLKRESPGWNGIICIGTEAFSVSTTYVPKGRTPLNFSTKAASGNFAANAFSIVRADVDCTITIFGRDHDLLAGKYYVTFGSSVAVTFTMTRGHLTVIRVDFNQKEGYWGGAILSILQGKGLIALF